MATGMTSWLFSRRFPSFLICLPLQAIVSRQTSRKSGGTLAKEQRRRQMEGALLVARGGHRGAHVEPVHEAYEENVATCFRYQEKLAEYPCRSSSWARDFLECRGPISPGLREVFAASSLNDYTGYVRFKRQPKTWLRIVAESGEDTLKNRWSL